ncbi:MAG TPA: malonyl-CoA synthase [Caulobacteraceae bacterium]
MAGELSNHLFDRLFSRGDPQAPALITQSASLSYARLLARSARWANALVDLGMRPGDRLAVQVEKSAANLILYLAAVRAGAVFLPLNPAYTPAEVAYFIADAAPRLLVCDPVNRDALIPICGGAIVQTMDGNGQGALAEQAARASEHFTTVARGPTDLAAICYTSGTTGRSKGAMLSHGNLAANAGTLRELWRFSEADVLIHALPLHHVHGLFVATHVLLMAGGSMILQPGFDPAGVIAAMPAATALMGVPTFYTRLLASPRLTREATSRMRLFISGSAPLLEQTHAAWRTRTGHVILERYGLTETGMNTSNPYDGERRAGTVGFPLPDVTLRITDRSSGQALAAGEAGMIEVKGPNVFPGYWRDPEKTTEAFRDGWFVTGDLGFIDSGGYVWIAGRQKDLVIAGGLNVYPREVEAAIDSVPGVIESAVIGVRHLDLGEAVTAVVAVRAADPPSEEAIFAALAGRLARFKIPRRILLVDHLPRNSMGKVEKSTLRDRYRGIYDPAP